MTLSNKIKVTRYQKAGDTGALVAFFSIIVPKWVGFYINDLKVFQGGGKFWIKLPDRTYEKDGEKKYAPYCGFENREISDKFQAEVLTAIDEYAKENARKEQEAQTQMPFTPDENVPF